MRNREELESFEEERIHHLGLRARESKGRRLAEAEDPLRTCFMRDRDRVIHSSAFRRMQLKTQVLPATRGDHFRTRLTHSLEVSQMARSTARSLGLNQDLAECVALAHDLGHPPFGHIGERVLNTLMSEHGGFRHNAQGLRILDSLEQRFPSQHLGLNLSWETRVCLLKKQVPEGFPVSSDLPKQTLPYLEGQIVDLCDRAAYVCHDFDDALRSELVGWDAFEDLELVAQARELAREQLRAQGESHPSPRLLRRRSVGAMVSLLVQDLALETDSAMQDHSLRQAEQIRKRDKYLARHSKTMAAKLRSLFLRLNESFYKHPEVLESISSMTERMKGIFAELMAYPERMSERYQKRIEEEGLQRTVCDYVSGMSDRYVERFGQA
ncbi:MAG: deoxyguanosinetriphosphate triphosphohydrolase [Planctomycetota bacterium]|nr:MAG: deoxyguanosinetriphosphate triphosphohydrolase [Planctomycetota bacterium]